MGILRKPPKKKRNRGLTRQQQREREERIRELIGQGYDFDDMKEITGFQSHVLRHYFQRILEKDRAMFESMTPESVFSDYVMNW